MRTPKKRHILALLLSVCMTLTAANVFPLVSQAEGNITINISLASGENAPTAPEDNYNIEYKFLSSEDSTISDPGIMVSHSKDSTEASTHPQSIPDNATQIQITGMWIGDNNKAMYNGQKLNIEDKILLSDLTDGEIGIHIQKDNNPGGQGGQQGPGGEPGGQEGPGGNNNRTPYAEGAISANITYYNEKDVLGAQRVEDLRYFDDSSINEDKDSSTNLLIHFMAPAGNILRKVLINNVEVSGIKPDKVTFEYFMAKSESDELNIQVYYNIDPAFSQKPNILWVYSEQTGQEKQSFDPQGRVDCLVEHGIVKIKSVTLPDGQNTEIENKHTLNYSDLTAKVDDPGRGPSPKYNEAWYDDGGENRQTGFGYAEITAGSTVVIEIIPDYGYQVSGAELNGCALTPQTEISTFTFVMGDSPLHLSAVFKEDKDTITDNSEAITGASISNGGNAANSGNLKLTVSDTSLNADAQTAVLAATNGDDISYVSTIDMTLDNIVSKGNGEFWESNITSFESNITVGLNLESPGAGYTYDVVRKHGDVLEDLNATYSNGVLSVPTNRFSEYSIIKKKAPFTPSYSAPASSATPNTENSGNITNSTDSNTNAASAKLEAKTEEITESILTEEEKALIKDGESLEVSLKVNEISEGSISATEKSIIETVTEANDLTMGTVFDINLFVTSGDDSRKVTNTKGGISISLELPKALINADSTVKRVYGVLRIHNGVSTLLNAKYDAATNTLSFETDRFSTYVLVYKDLGEDDVTENITDTVTETEFDGTVVDKPETNTEKTEQSAPSSSIKSPKTADDLVNYLMLISIMLTIISLGVTLLAVRKK